MSSGSRWDVEPSKFWRWTVRHRTAIRLVLALYLIGDAVLMAFAVRRHLTLQIVTGSMNVLVALIAWYSLTVALPRGVRQWDHHHASDGA